MLLGKGIKHQLKPINLADVFKQTELEIPNLHKALNVGCHIRKLQAMFQNEVKRQHYVPRTYLRHFATERNGEFFIKALPIANCTQDKIFELNISNVCLEKNLYSLPGETHKQRMLVEKFYSENYETHYNNVYEILTNPNKSKLTLVERELIISTVVTMFYRTTKWINQHNEFFDRVLETAYNLCQETGKESFKIENEEISIKGKTLEQLKKESRFESRPAQVLTQLEVALKLINVRILNDQIFVTKLLDSDCEFITSDNPVICSNIKSNFLQPFDPTNILKLPLDNKHMLFLMPYADVETINFLARHNTTGLMCFTEKLTSNFQQFKNSERFLLGSDNSLNSYLQTKEVSEKPYTEEVKKEFGEIYKTRKY